MDTRYGTYTVTDVSVRPPAVYVKLTDNAGAVIKFRMTEKLWDTWRLNRGSSVTEDMMEQIRADSEKCEAMTKAISYLSYSSYSVKELEMKLRRAGFSSESSRLAAVAAEKKGLIDEREQAQRIAYREAESKRRGPIRIKQYLLAHGYSRETADAAAGAVGEEIYAHALEAELSRRCPYGIPVEAADRQRLTASMVRQGFSVSDVIKAFEKFEN